MVTSFPTATETQLSPIQRKSFPKIIDLEIQNTGPLKKSLPSSTSELDRRASWDLIWT